MKTYAERIVSRLDQLVDELVSSSWLSYNDRLHAFYDLCIGTPMLSTILTNLPDQHYDFGVDWRFLPEHWPKGDASIAYRWDAIRQVVEKGSEGVHLFEYQVSSSDSDSANAKFTNMFVIPIYDFFVHNIERSNLFIYFLLRYKRWVEWFEFEKLNDLYHSAEKHGEDVLDTHLRRWLFASGIDYPFSRPRSPGGEADVVAIMEKEDPLVLEVKVWDSTKDYRENRVRDGLRQVMEYASKYGKNEGYVVVYNIDKSPLEFISDTDVSEWPPRLEIGGCNYYFISVDIVIHETPVSQREKGRRVKTNKIHLTNLLDKT